MPSLLNLFAISEPDRKHVTPKGMKSANLISHIGEEFPYESTQFIGRKKHYEMSTLADLSVLDSWAKGSEVFD